MVNWHVVAVRAHEAVGPSPVVQGVEALLFGSIEREELVEADAFLELQPWNSPYLSVNYMATFYTK